MYSPHPDGCCELAQSRPRVGLLLHYLEDWTTNETIQLVARLAGASLYRRDTLAPSYSPQPYHTRAVTCQPKPMNHYTNSHAYGRHCSLQNRQSHVYISLSVLTPGIDNTSRIKRHLRCQTSGQASMARPRIQCFSNPPTTIHWTMSEPITPGYYTACISVRVYHLSWACLHASGQLEKPTDPFHPAGPTMFVWQ